MTWYVAPSLSCWCCCSDRCGYLGDVFAQVGPGANLDALVASGSWQVPAEERTDWGGGRPARLGSDHSTPEFWQDVACGRHVPQIRLSVLGMIVWDGRSIPAPLQRALLPRHCTGPCGRFLGPKKYPKPTRRRRLDGTLSHLLNVPAGAWSAAGRLDARNRRVKETTQCP